MVAGGVVGKLMRFVEQVDDEVARGVVVPGIGEEHDVVECGGGDDGIVGEHCHGAPRGNGRGADCAWSGTGSGTWSGAGTP